MGIFQNGPYPYIYCAPLASSLLHNENTAAPGVGEVLMWRAGAGSCFTPSTYCPTTATELQYPYTSIQFSLCLLTGNKFWHFQCQTEWTSQWAATPGLCWAAWHMVNTPEAANIQSQLAPNFTQVFCPNQCLPTSNISITEGKNLLVIQERRYHHTVIGERIPNDFPQVRHWGLLQHHRFSYLVVYRTISKSGARDKFTKLYRCFQLKFKSLVYMTFLKTMYFLLVWKYIQRWWETSYFKCEGCKQSPKDIDFLEHASIHHLKIRPL